MRLALAALILVWCVLTVVGYTAVLPERTRDDQIIKAYHGVAASVEHPRVLRVLEAYRSELEADADLAVPPGGLGSIPALGAAGRAPYYDAFRRAYARVAPGLELPPLRETPTIVWSTDDNPVRPLQLDLFRRWHLREYGEPIEIMTDPSNRELVKSIIQSIAGAGPDVIEAFGPPELQQLVDTGLALDITDVAIEKRFDVSRVFATAIPSMAQGGRQYAFPCNIGYMVLMYHRDIFRDAGVPEPRGHWTYDDLIETSEALVAAGVVEKPFIISGLVADDMALQLGVDILRDDGALSLYNSPQTVRALQVFHDLIYQHKVGPTPAEAASKATSGGSSIAADAQRGGAGAFFLNKDSAMVINGRWVYVLMAQKNFTVIREAIDRRLGELGEDGSAEAEREAELLRTARARVAISPLTPLSDDQLRALRAVLTDEDRRRLLDVGVAHVPTITGVPLYMCNGRVAVANARSERADRAVRFLEFLASEEYNEHINATFDSICAMPEFCFDEDGVSGPPHPLPGLESFDSPVFADAVRGYARPDVVSPFIGRARLDDLRLRYLERIQANSMAPAVAALRIEEAINRQIAANLVKDPALRELWEEKTGVAFDPNRDLREQVEAGGS